MYVKAVAGAAIVAVASILAFSTTSSPSLAQAASSSTAGTFKVDPVHSQAVYRITHLNSSAHWGLIKEPTGTFEVSADGSLKVDVSVDIAKLDSANPKRDEHLRNADFFNSKQFPQMTFKSTEGRRDGDNFLVKGDLTVKGQAKPVEVTFKKVGEGKTPKGETVAGYEAEFTIKRLEKRGSTYWLVSDNPTHQSIDISLLGDGFEVWGVVTHVITEMINGKLHEHTRTRRI